MYISYLYNIHTIYIHTKIYKIYDPIYLLKIQPPLSASLQLAGFFIQTTGDGPPYEPPMHSQILRKGIQQNRRRDRKNGSKK